MVPVRKKGLMATAALRGKRRAVSMGLPCEKDTEDQPRPVNHENVDSGGEDLGSSEPQEMRSSHDTPNTGMNPNLLLHLNT